MTHPLARRLAAGAPDWARRPMLAWDHDELSRRRPFVTASEWRAFSTIELPEIVGTAHPDHAGLSRTQLLECGERMPHNLARAAENPGYYTDDGPKLPLMHYVGYAGGPLFVGRDGNHRTAIASCLLPLDHGTQHLAGVTIERHRHDAAAQDAYDELAILLAARRLRVQPLAIPRLLGRDDGPGWSCETFVPVVALFYRGGHREQLTPQQVADRATALRRGTWPQRWAGWLRYALTHRPGRPRMQQP